MEHVVEGSLVDEFCREEVLASLRRLERQIHEIAELVGVSDCDVTVLAQLSSIVASTRRLERLVVLEHIHRQLVAARDQPLARLDDINQTIARYYRIVS